jgi:hypothetical protein
MSYGEIQLVDGYAYLQVRKFETLDKEGNQLKSKKGSPMMTIQWNAADLYGNVGSIYDFIVASVDWKLFNLMNALGIKSLYDEAGQKFNAFLLKHGHCAAIIKRDPTNPKYFKIESYIPLEFLKTVQEHHKREEQKPNRYAMAKTENTPALTQHTNNVVLGTDEELDDDIPF